MRCHREKSAVSRACGVNVCPAVALAGVFAVGLPAAGADETPNGYSVFHAQGEMAGEVTRSSVLLQSRLTATKAPVEGGVPGTRGVARFEYSTDRDMTSPKRTDWIEAVPARDYIVKTKISNLRPETRYYYRLVFGPDRETARSGQVATFQTLPGRERREKTEFVVAACMNYAFFYHGRDGRGRGAYQGPDKSLGYPALESILELTPDFVVFTGDSVYYDHPAMERAKTLGEMRQKWHEQFVQPRFVDLLRQVPAYWQKDDHDHRFNDSDAAGDRLPSHELGIDVFQEQVPVVDPRAGNAERTYRTHRVSRDLQIWLVEGRDYRDPNAMPDGPRKSIWGQTQKHWLKETLLASDATFKLLVSPTPMVGPDRRTKRDNHTNPKGFRHEGEAFFRWLAEHDFRERNFFVLCGDRHWQYHSVHPTGYAEFSCGALVDANAIAGVVSGDPQSTDPKGLIQQHHIQREPSGGFLHVWVRPATDSRPPRIQFIHRDERGKVFYRFTSESERKGASP